MSGLRAGARAWGLAVWTALAAAAPATGLCQTPAEPEGYRMEAYRAPTPETLAGVEVVDDEAAYALWRGGETAFIDVLPRTPRPANLPEGVIWRQKPHRSIPGALWLPNVGYGALHASTEAYLRAGLRAATEGEAEHPVLIFCQADCWMSWNAAKRARAYGYSAVYWYPDGTDGWDFNDWPTTPLAPFEAP